MTDLDAIALYKSVADDIELPSGSRATFSNEQIVVTTRYGNKCHISTGDLRALFFCLKGQSLIEIQRLKELYGDS